MSRKKKAGIALLILLILLAAMAGGIYWIGHRYYAKTNFLSDEEATEQIRRQKEEMAASEAEPDSEIDGEDEEEADGDTEEEASQEEPEPDPELLEAQRKMALYSSTEPITTDGNVYNILLVGLDTTKDNWVGNSDSMILISLNYRLHRVSMISLMRDTHVMIPGIGYRKLNAAYPNGGGPLLTKTVEENFKIDVDRYVSVKFGDMIDIVDEIGTIEITFTQKEAENANKSIKQQCRILGLKSKKYLIPGEGTYQCNGMQAVAYARIRKVGNSDYQRTERQREVLMKLLEKIKAMSLEDLDRLATRLLPLLTHNVPENEFWGLLAKAPTLLNYNIIQDRIPYDGMFYSNGDLIPDMERTVRKLKETIYGEDMLDEEGHLAVPTPQNELDGDGNEVSPTGQETEAGLPSSSNENGETPGDSANPGDLNSGSANSGVLNPGESNAGSANPGGLNPGESNAGSANPGESNAGSVNLEGSSMGGANPGDSNLAGSNPVIWNPAGGDSDSANLAGSGHIETGRTGSRETRAKEAIPQDMSLRPWAQITPTDLWELEPVIPREKKAAILADNLPEEEPEEEEPKPEKKTLSNPYEPAEFSLQVETAPSPTNQYLARQKNRWTKSVLEQEKPFYENPIG